MTWKETEYLSSNDICQIAGATYRQIDVWCRTGLLRASGTREAKPGTGNRRVWIALDALVARTLQRLSAIGAASNAMDAVATLLYGSEGDVDGKWMVICPLDLTRSNAGWNPPVELQLVDDLNTITDSQAWVLKPSSMSAIERECEALIDGRTQAQEDVARLERQLREAKARIRGRMAS